MIYPHTTYDSLYWYTMVLMWFHVEIPSLDREKYRFHITILNGREVKYEAITSRPKHDDVIKWKHFPRNWPFVRSRWIPQTKGQWRGALMFYLICVWINGWVNNREAGDLRRHLGHYDVNVMNDIGGNQWLMLSVAAEYIDPWCQFHSLPSVLIASVGLNKVSLSSPRSCFDFLEIGL